MDAVVWGSGKVQRHGKMFDVHSVRDALNMLALSQNSTQAPKPPSQSWLTGGFGSQCSQDGAGPEPHAPEGEVNSPQQPSFSGGFSGFGGGGVPDARAGGFNSPFGFGSSSSGDLGRQQGMGGQGYTARDAAEAARWIGQQVENDAMARQQASRALTYGEVHFHSNDGRDAEDEGIPATGGVEDGCGESGIVVRLNSAFGGTRARRKSSFGAELQTLETLARIRADMESETCENQGADASMMGMELS